MTHEQLTGCNPVVRAVGPSVYIQGAGAADSFAAVVIECHRLLTFIYKLLIKDIEHFQERGIRLYSGNMISLETALFAGVLLTPYLKIEFHKPYSL